MTPTYPKRPTPEFTVSRDQIVIFVILSATVAMFLWGRWRHDMVALGALLASVFAGLVPTADAFAGFGHPAVITVACVLVLSRGLQSSGAIDAIIGRKLDLIDSKRYTGEFPLPHLKIIKAVPTPSFRALSSIHIKGKP